MAALSEAIRFHTLFNNPENQQFVWALAWVKTSQQTRGTSPYVVLGFVPQQDWLPIKQPNVIN